MPLKPSRKISSVFLFLSFLSYSLVPSTCHLFSERVLAASDELYFIHTDHLGSKTVVTDKFGEVVKQTRTFPYGSTREIREVPKVRLAHGSPTEREFTGQIKDKATQLHYYNARYYDTALGTFTSVDTVDDGLNRFAYVGGNPANIVDSSGHVAGPVRENSWWNKFTQGLVDTAQFLKADFNYMVSGGKSLGQRAVAGADILTFGQFHRATFSFNEYASWWKATGQEPGFSNFGEKFLRAGDPGFQITFLAEGVVSPLYSQVRTNASQRANQLRGDIDDVLARNFPADETRPFFPSRQKQATDEVVDLLGDYGASVDVVPSENLGKNLGNAGVDFYNEGFFRHKVNISATQLDDVGTTARELVTPQQQLSTLLHEAEHVAQSIEGGMLSNTLNYEAQMLLRGYWNNAFESGARDFSRNLMWKHMIY